MKPHALNLIYWSLLAGIVGWWGSSLAQQPQFNSLQFLTNKEAALSFTAPTGRSYRIEVATNTLNWNGLVTFATNTTTSLQHTDSAAPYLPTRFYRAAQLTGTNILSGDHLATTNGDVIIHPVDHASFVLQWNDVIIHNDPAVSAMTSRPKPDLILISHNHGDHYQPTVLSGVWKPTTIFISPFALPGSFQNNTIILANGASTNVLGLTVQAVPAYNANHTLGTGNGYVLTIGGRRIYISGDTGNQPEIRALPNIDVAFLCINQPFTMTVNDATNCIRAMKPKVVYPYHYRDQSGATTNAAVFKQRLGADLGIEVRLRKWY